MVAPDPARWVPGRRQIPGESDIPLHGWAPYSAIHRERIRAHKKHVDKGGSMEAVRWDSSRWLPVVAEEFGEVARVLNEMDLGNANYSTTITSLRKELTQLGAMVAAWMDAVEEGGW